MEVRKWKMEDLPSPNFHLLSSIFHHLPQRLQNLLRQHLRCVLAERGILDLVAALGPLLSRRHVCHPAIGVTRNGGEWKGRAALDLQTSFTKRLDVAAHQGD